MMSRHRHRRPAGAVALDGATFPSTFRSRGFRSDYRRGRLRRKGRPPVLALALPWKIGRALSIPYRPGQVNTGNAKSSAKIKAIQERYAGNQGHCHPNVMKALVEQAGRLSPGC